MFKHFSAAVAKQFQAMVPTGLYQVDLNKDDLWALYLASFPEGSNPIYRKRTEHDCSCCRQFIKTLGNVVTIKNNKIVTLWDLHMDQPHYQAVAEALAVFVRIRAITNFFLHPQGTVGTAKTFEELVGGQVQSWDHFQVTLPKDVVLTGERIGPRLADTHSTFDVLRRGLQELDQDAIDTVLDLIAQNSLYRGEEHQASLAKYRALLTAFKRIQPEQKDFFCWAQVRTESPALLRLRNTAIGTLLVDLSKGTELEDAVKAFEKMVAPTNYKRPTALVSKGMIAKARQTLEEQGLVTALERRYATLEDITVNNILFADRRTAATLGGDVFDQLTAGVPDKVKNLDKIETVGIEDFVTKILPTAKSLEVFFDNTHQGNLVNLVAPADPTAKRLFKWDNGFSWSYAGDLADSIKARVKAAGGSVTGDFRASLSWFNHDDLDLHLRTPTGGHIYFREKQDRGTGGALDVDMNVGCAQSRTPVENITFPTRTRMPEGVYTLTVDQFTRRETTDPGFEVELEFDGTVYHFAYFKAMRTCETVTVAKFEYSHAHGLKILESLPSGQTSKQAWGLSTQAFHRVNVVMLSPNHWDGQVGLGNKHYFFMLDGCQHEGQVRGFYNEFLHQDLNPHRKVLEMIGAKMKTEESDRQLSGLGFSSTQRNTLVVRVTGAFTRLLKIQF